jgi:glucose/arabinose dehydrogenase
VSQKSKKFSRLHDAIVIALFGLLLLSVIPTVISSSSSSMNVVQPAVGQPEDPFPVTGNETLTPAQRAAREQLLKQEGFSVNVIVRNLSAPLNILYGPDNTLWIAERVGKNITRIDPINGTELSSTPVTNVNQSAGQDGLLGMEFDPNYNNTHHIYVAYTYDADPSEQDSCAMDSTFQCNDYSLIYYCLSPLMKYLLSM